MLGEKGRMLGRTLGRMLRAGITACGLLMTSLLWAQSSYAPLPNAQGNDLHERREPSVRVMVDDPGFQSSLQRAKERAERNNRASPNGTRQLRSPSDTQVRVIELPESVQSVEKKNLRHVFVFNGVTEDAGRASSQEASSSLTRVGVNLAFREKQIETLRRAAAGKK